MLSNFRQYPSMLSHGCSVSPAERVFTFWCSRGVREDRGADGTEQLLVHCANHTTHVQAHGLLQMMEALRLSSELSLCPCSMSWPFLSICSLQSLFCFFLLENCMRSLKSAWPDLIWSLTSLEKERSQTQEKRQPFLGNVQVFHAKQITSFYFFLEIKFNKNNIHLRFKTN